MHNICTNDPLISPVAKLIVNLTSQIWFISLVDSFNDGQKSEGIDEFRFSLGKIHFFEHQLASINGIINNIEKIKIEKRLK